MAIKKFFARTEKKGGINIRSVRGEPARPSGFIHRTEIGRRFIEIVRHGRLATHGFASDRTAYGHLSHPAVRIRLQPFRIHCSWHA